MKAFLKILFIVILFRPFLFAQNHQLINYTNAIIPDFQVNEDAGPNGSDLRWATVFTLDNGNFVITWRGFNGGSDIYAQNFTSDFSMLG